MKKEYIECDSIEKMNKLAKKGWKFVGATTFNTQQSLPGWNTRYIQETTYILERDFNPYNHEDNNIKKDLQELQDRYDIDNDMLQEIIRSK